MATGTERRLARILPPSGALVLPLDGGLIDGPLGALQNTRDLLTSELLRNIDAIIGFPGLLKAYSAVLHDTPFILNLSASTTLQSPTAKRLISTVGYAVAMGADAVCYQIHTTDEFEGAMLRSVGSVVSEAGLYGMPVLITAYPRRQNADGIDNFAELKSNDFSAYLRLVRHTVRIAAELGADMIKTTYTGDPESFTTVVASAMGVPVLAAGGMPVTVEQAVQNARDAMLAGARGVAYGRQIFLDNAPHRVAAEVKSALIPQETSRSFAQS